jgi:hypothetical protein
VYLRRLPTLPPLLLSALVHSKHRTMERPPDRRFDEEDEQKEMEALGR